MPAPSLSPWFLFGLLVAACGPEPPRPDDTHADSSAGQGGSGIVIATSDGPPSAGSTTGTPSGTNDRTAGSAAASGGALPTTTSTTGAASSGASGVDGAGGDRTSSDAAGGASVGHGGASSDAGGGEASGGGGGGQDAGETATGGELVPPIAVGALLISEYLEGSSGSDKAIELSNMSSDVLALEACQLVIYFNGKSTPGNEVPLMGELLPGTSHTLCHSRSSAELLARCDQPTGSASFNGDDAIVLECDGLAHDSIGQVGVLPDANQWGDGDLGTKDQILRRRCGSLPRTDPTSPFDVTLEWVKVSDEGVAGLGDPACIERTEEPADP